MEKTLRSSVHTVPLLHDKSSEAASTLIHSSEIKPDQTPKLVTYFSDAYFTGIHGLACP